MINIQFSLQANVKKFTLHRKKSRVSNKLQKIKENNFGFQTLLFPEENNNEIWSVSVNLTAWKSLFSKIFC